MDQGGRVDVEAVGKLEEIAEAQVALTALDLTDERPVKAAPSGQTLLTEAKVFAAGTHAPAEFGGG